MCPRLKERSFSAKIIVLSRQTFNQHPCLVFETWQFSSAYWNLHLKSTAANHCRKGPRVAAPQRFGWQHSYQLKMQKKNLSLCPDLVEHELTFWRLLHILSWTLIRKNGCFNCQLIYVKRFSTISTGYIALILQHLYIITGYWTITSISKPNFDALIVFMYARVS